MGSTVQVYYPFHPLHGQELEVAYRARREDGCVTVIDSEGVRLQIPAWMLVAEAARHCLSSEAAISGSALLRLCDLVGIEFVQETVDPTQADGIRDLKDDSKIRPVDGRR